MNQAFEVIQGHPYCRLYCLATMHTAHCYRRTDKQTPLSWMWVD